MRYELHRNTIQHKSSFTLRALISEQARQVSTLLTNKTLSKETETRFCNDKESCPIVIQAVSSWTMARSNGDFPSCIPSTLPKPKLCV